MSQQAEEVVARHWGEMAKGSAVSHWTDSRVVLEHISRLISGDPAQGWFEYACRKYLLKSGRGVENGLSLGCGDGTLEREARRLGACRLMDAYDLAPGAVEEARCAAARESIDGIDYRVANLEEIELPQRRYDVVFASASVHHIKNLEHLFEQVAACLRPGGLFIMNEYVGPTQFQASPRSVQIINDILALLPPKLRRRASQPEEVVTRFQVQTIESMNEIDPSEAIRSADILRLLPRWFTVLERKDFGGTINHHLLRDIAHNFDQDTPDGAAPLALLCYLESLLIREGVLDSDFSFVVAAPRPGAAWDGAPAAPASRPRCSVIIPVYGKAPLTRQCLDALLAHPPGDAECETVVVDDASPDLTSQLLACYGDRVRVVAHPQNVGFATSCNDGAAAATGEFLVFLNNDTIPQPGWLDALVNYARRQPCAGAVGAKLLFPDDTIQHAGVAVCQDHNPRHLYAGFPADHPAVNKSRRFQIVTAACMLIRREAFARAGGFDPSFRNGYEDVDLCLRLGELGYEVHYCHESVLYHLESVSRQNVCEHQERNLLLYRERWAHRVVPDDVRFYIEDGLLAIDYWELYPARLLISPLLAVLPGEERERRADRILNDRARKMFELLRDNIRLNLRAQEVELRAAALQTNGSAPWAAPKPPGPAAQPRLLCEGTILRPAGESTDRLLSILMPVKNGAAKLRELLPRVLGQKTRDPIEIVAVDSGSADDTVDVLREAGATVVAIDPASFNHGLTRNLAAAYARGSILVFLNQSAVPADEHWLANLVAPLDEDPNLVGVCSRTQPRPDADLLARRDGLRNIDGAPERSARAITDRAAYAALAHHELRLFVRFHTMSAAVRADVFRRIPFRETDFGEDLTWGKEVLEAGFKIQNEPSSVVLHSHNYSFLDIFRRNFDDGFANRQIVGRRFTEDQVLPEVLCQVHDDWRYFEQECRLEPAALEHWRFASVLRRTAQTLGQWLGVNWDAAKGGCPSLLSITEQIKAGGRTETADGGRG